MKYPTYIASLILVSAGVAVAAPPTKLHHPKAKDLRVQKDQHTQVQQMNNVVRSSQRPATIALNIERAAVKNNKGRDLKRNQFHSYRPQDRMTSDYERR